MNLTYFDNNCDSFLKTCSVVNYNIKYRKQFPQITRKIFDRALRDFLDLIREDNNYNNNSIKYFHTARQIVCLDKVHKQINVVLQNINTLRGPKFFSIKISKLVIPEIDKRINKLKNFVLSSSRLPFNSGKEREWFFNKTQKTINCFKLSNTNQLRTEYFHLLGDHLKINNLKNLNLDLLEGSWGINSLLSWSNIIQVFSKNYNIDLGNKILNKINKAIPIATKISFAHPKALETFTPAISYYQDLVNTFGDPFSSQQMHFIDFSNKYNLDNISSVPLDIIKNEITWDIIKNIQEMKKEEEQFFLLGTHYHRVAVQITCLMPGGLEKLGSYKYEIFNTGEGALLHHCVKQEGEKNLALPLTYHAVPLRFLSYEFFDYLVDCALRQSDINAFYNWHQEMFSKKGILQDLNSGRWYERQYFGTCSFKCLEVGIKSQLNPKQIQQLEYTKTQIAVQKQRYIVSALEKDTGPNGRIPLEKINQLKEVRLLLKLGEKYLSQLTQNLCSIQCG